MKIKNNSKSLEIESYIIIFIIVFAICELNLFGQNQQNENIPSTTFYLMDDINAKSIDKKVLDEKELMIGFGVEGLYNLLTLKNDNYWGFGYLVYTSFKFDILNSISNKLKLNSDIGYSNSNPTLNKSVSSTFSYYEVTEIGEVNLYIQSIVIRPSLTYDFDFLIANLGFGSNFVVDSKVKIKSEWKVKFMGQEDKPKNSENEAKIENYNDVSFNLNLGISKKINLESGIYIFTYFAYDFPLSTFGDTNIYGSQNNLKTLRLGFNLFW